MKNQTFSLVFTKKFLSGNLAGLTYTDFISFPTIESRSNWVNGIKANVLDWEFTGDILYYRNASREEAIEDYSMWAF